MKWCFEFLNFLIVPDVISVLFCISILLYGFLLCSFFFLNSPDITPGNVLVSRLKI